MGMIPISKFNPMPGYILLLEIEINTVVLSYWTGHEIGYIDMSCWLNSCGSVQCKLRLYLMV